MHKRLIRCLKNNFLCTASVFLLTLFVCSTVPANALEKEIRTIRASVGNLFIKPSELSSIIDILTKGDKVAILREDGDWLAVELKDKRLGWIHKNLVTPPLDNNIPSETKNVKKDEPLPENRDKNISFYVVEVKSGRVRKKPSLDGPVMFGLKKGDKVSVTKIKDDWYHIVSENGKQGWAHKSLFEKEFFADQSKIIKNIRFEITPQGDEKLIFELNGFYPPKTFALDEEVIPKIVCDFSGASLSPGIRQKLKTNGRLIKKVRIGIHDKPEQKIRIVADLNPGRTYGIDQIFYKKTRLYVLTVKSNEN